VPEVLHWWRAMGWMFGRERRAFVRAPQDVLLAIGLHWVAVSLFPLGLGADPGLLFRAAPGVFWVCALWGVVLWLPRLFATDQQDGTLEQCLASGVPLSAIVVGKLLFVWLAAGAGLVLASGLLGMQFGLNASQIGVLCVSLALGLLTLVCMGSVLAAVALLARGAHLLVPLLALPLFVPALVFGSASLEAAQYGASAMAPIQVLAALALLAAAFSPVLTVAVLRLAID